MTGREVRRHILIIQGELRGDILRTGQGHGTRHQRALYEELLWELDLLGLRGE